MIEVPEIKVQIPAAKPKFTASGSGLCWRVVAGGVGDAYFYGPNAEQYAREHAERLNAEASAVEPGTTVRDLPPMTLFRVASRTDVLMFVGSCNCWCLSQQGCDVETSEVSGNTPVTAIIGRPVFTEGE